MIDIKGLGGWGLEPDKSRGLGALILGCSRKIGRENPVVRAAGAKLLRAPVAHPLFIEEDIQTFAKRAVDPAGTVVVLWRCGPALFLNSSFLAQFLEIVLGETE